MPDDYPRTMREEIEHLRRIGNKRFAALIEKHTTPDHDPGTRAAR